MIGLFSYFEVVEPEEDFTVELTIQVSKNSY
jgi:hypothetical protein